MKEAENQNSRKHQTPDLVAGLRLWPSRRAACVCRCHFKAVRFPCVCCIAAQLEESEFTCAAAVKARKSMEVEIEDLHVQMEDISKTKQAVSTALYFRQPLQAITVTCF